jgi:hypothetical protein
MYRRALLVLALAAPGVAAASSDPGAAGYTGRKGAAIYVSKRGDWNGAERWF